MTRLGRVITLRHVAPEDADILLAWRNDPTTRSASLSSVEIDRSAHIAWLGRTIADPERALYIGELDGSPIGTVRFDRDSADAAEISITVAPAHRGRRLSLPLLQAGLDANAAEASAPTLILARIREENAASRALFAAAGFREVGGPTDGVLLLSLDRTRSTDPR